MTDLGRVAELRTLSHDLSLNLARYVATAQALEDGVPRPLQATTLLMPRYEDVRVVISAEQDAVTGTCFALGFKTFEGWDGEQGKVIGDTTCGVARRSAPTRETPRARFRRTRCCGRSRRR